PADDYAAKLLSLSTTVLGKDGQIRFTKSTPTPAIPKEFKGILVQGWLDPESKKGWDQTLK
ncbi:MAG: hypothetical protein ACXWFQ_07645, partial [Thermoanaerobaculia bacterium]